MAYLPTDRDHVELLVPFVHDEITITIDETGDLAFLDSAMAEPFKILGTTEIRRASHVEPYEFLPRLAFSVIRMLVSDDSKIAEWTRTWGCRWRVNLSPIGGKILQWGDLLNWNSCDCPEGIAWWWDRERAIEAEIKAVNELLGGAK
jgi:hypothetical protein